MNFENRQGTNLNRKKIKIVSQTANEIIADIERADNATVEGTPIDAGVFNAFQSEINSANTNASSALSAATQASTDASNALTAATTASDNSSLAVQQSSLALQTANRVENSLADRGASIKIGGVAQIEVEFDENPQTQLNNKVNTSDLVNLVYPVGSIYISVNATNPANFLGGTWEAFAEGRTLIGVGSSDQNFALGSMGGESSHTLTAAEMPSHNHTQSAHTHEGVLKNFRYWFNLFTHSANRTNIPFANGGVYNNSDNSNVTLQEQVIKNNTNAIGSGSSWGSRQIQLNWDHKPEMLSSTPTINNTGGNAAHNNLMPYIVAHIWKRVA